LINISIMSHLVSYYWFRRTQYIPRFGGVLQECGDFTWRLSDSWRVKWGLLTGDDVSDLAKSISVW